MGKERVRYKNVKAIEETKQGSVKEGHTSDSPLNFNGISTSDIKLDLRKVECEGVDCFNWFQDKIQ
jgi:hypothetical protein